MERSGGPRLVTARAAGETAVLLFPDASMQQIGRDIPQVWFAVAELLSEQLAATLRRMGEAIGLPPRARLRTRPATLAHQDAATGVWEVRATQTDLAEMTGLSRKSAGAHLLALQRAGMIELGYRSIRVSPHCLAS